MEKKKKENPTKKLEEEFHDFQKQWNTQWNKFLTNDFSHLVAKVDTLVEQNVGIQQNMVTMEKNILKALGARAYDWVEKEVTKEGK